MLIEYSQYLDKKCFVKVVWDLVFMMVVLLKVESFSFDSFTQCCGNGAEMLNGCNACRFISFIPLISYKRIVTRDTWYPVESYLRRK
jgi:hypothetical protein